MRIFWIKAFDDVFLGNPLAGTAKEEGEDAKDKKTTMDTYWIPGVNNVRTYGKWAFAEFTDVWTLAADLDERIKMELDQTIERLIPASAR